MRSSDVELLNTFKNCLNINNRIGRTQNGKTISYRVQFGSIQFYNWLKKIGLFPAKSYTIGEIDIPDKFFRDYLRGCIDGDGNICTYKDLYNVYKGRKYVTQRLFIKIVSASKKHIVWLRNKITALNGSNGAIIKDSPADKQRVPMWILKFAKKESLRLLSWIYYQPDIPCLERKHMTAVYAIEEISKQKRRVYSRI
ncbi:MAG: hypothetical protein HYW90_01030 [Candidatus Sungbacteria bacterium]|nr:hypothetical protein [Candidatus Sungbacteria bacterium]